MRLLAYAALTFLLLLQQLALAQNIASVHKRSDLDDRHRRNSRSAVEAQKGAARTVSGNRNRFATHSVLRERANDGDAGRPG